MQITSKMPNIKVIRRKLRNVPMMFDDVVHSVVLYQTDDNKYHIIESSTHGVKQTEVNLTIEKTNEKSCHYLINGEPCSHI